MKTRRLYAVDMYVRYQNSTHNGRVTLNFVGDSITDVLEVAKPLTGYGSFEIKGIKDIGAVQVLP